MQEKLNDIIKKIQSHEPRVANAIIFKHELNEGEINDLLDWAKQHRHYELMRACIARKIENVDDVAQKLAGLYIEILKHTVYKDKQNELDDLLKAKYFTQEDLGADNTTALMSIRLLRKGDTYDGYLLIQTLESIESTTGVSPSAALMYCHDMVLTGQSVYRFVVGYGEIELSEIPEIINPPRDALHRAALTGELDLVKFLLSLGHETTEEEKEICTNELKALCAQPEPIANKIAALILAGADFVDIRINGVPLLIMVIKCEHTGVIQAILESPHCTPEMLNAKNNDGNTALHLAAQSWNVEVIQAILESPKRSKEMLNAKNNDGYTTLHIAALNWHVEVVQAILASPHCTPEMLNAKNNDGDTALHLAARYGRTYVMEAILASPHCTPEMLNAKNDNGDTPLYLAALNEYIEIVQAILESPHCTVEMLNVKNNDGYTALQIADRAGHKKVLAALLKKAEDLQNVKNEGNINGLLYLATEQLSSASMPQTQSAATISNLGSITDNIPKITQETQSKGFGK